MAKRGRKPQHRGVKAGIFRRTFSWIFRKVFGLLWWVGLRVGLVTAAVLSAAVLYYYSSLPDSQHLFDGRERGSVTLLDRNGDVFAWRGEQYQITRADSASQHLVNAVVATEDKRFYSHFGLDPIGIARAMASNIKAGRVVQGGSTITQQAAKLLFFDNSRSLVRHIKQVPIVLAMELKYSKDDILSIYLNRSYLGAGAQGFEAAAQRYFGKSARDVNPSEAAMLAGLLKAPSRYAPTSNLSGAQDRAEVIIGLMEDQGYLTRVEADIARASPAELSPAASARAGGYFADWVMEKAPEYLTKQTTEDVIISTTLDQKIQRSAEAALKEIFETKVREGSKAEAAIVVMSPDGAVRAMVGGRATDVSGGFNRATQARRQPGSAFKPFVYAAGLEAGMLPTDIMVDEPITLNIPGSGPWSPKNYTREYLGPITLTEALKHSINTVAVKVSERAGRARVKAIAQDFGIDSPIADGPALALGVSEVTLTELTGAYAGILNGGRRSRPYGMTELRLKGDDGFALGSDRDTAIRVMDEHAAGYLVYMLNQVVQDGTGARAILGDRPAAGKTGTTQAARDAWFIGFTGDYVTGVWMGYDDNTPLTGVTGGGLPAEIWREVMMRIHEGLPPSPLPMIVPPEPEYVIGQAYDANGNPIGGIVQAGQEADGMVEEVLKALLSNTGLY
jgi:1A family penicillin-binding protein